MMWLAQQNLKEEKTEKPRGTRNKKKRENQQRELTLRP
jgi:hypothetical protein